MTIKQLSADYFASPTLREFVRLASDKPAFKDILAPAPQTIEKTAAAHEEPSSFTEALIKLCEELRSGGFTSYAYTLEQKFLLFKQADAYANSEIVKQAERHLYNVHDESGHDLIEFAHPGGGNRKLDEHWDDLGDVETIEERHQKMLAVLKKIPTEKSVRAETKAPSIVALAKIILAAPDDKSTLNSIVIENISRMKHVLTVLKSMVDNRGGFPVGAGSVFGNPFDQGRGGFNSRVKLALDALDVSPPTLQSLKQVSNDVEALKQLFADLENEDIKALGQMLNEFTSSKTDPMSKGLLGETHNAIARLQSMDEEAELGGPGAVTSTPATQGANHGASVYAEIAQATTTASKFLNGTLTDLNNFEGKVAGDPAKAGIVKQTKISVQTVISDLGALGTLVMGGRDIATAANEAGSKSFAGVASIDQLKSELTAYFDQVTDILRHLAGA